MPQALAEHDARACGAIPERYLEAYWSRLAGRVGARRLGVGRRGRLLVPARPLRRHAEHRRQAHRAGRVRVGRGRPPRGGRGLRGRRARPGQGRGGLALLRGRSRVRARRRAAQPRCAPTSPTVLGKAFAPGRVEFVPALPKTRSAKIVRRAVRAAALGLDPGDLSSLENPEALDSRCHRAAGW